MRSNDSHIIPLNERNRMLIWNCVPSQNTLKIKTISWLWLFGNDEIIVCFVTNLKYLQVRGLTFCLTWIRFPHLCAPDADDLYRRSLIAQFSKLLFNRKFTEQISLNFFQLIYLNLFFSLVKISHLFYKHESADGFLELYSIRRFFFPFKWLLIFPSRRYHF